MQPRGGIGRLGWLLLLALGSCSQSQAQLVFRYSESLQPIAREVGARFEENHPSVAILHHPLPDLQLLEEVVAGRQADLIAVADGRFLERLLIPERSSGYWLIGGDELVLATDRRDLWDSPAELANWRDGWVDLIFQQSLALGIVDPDRDALGYYTKLAWKLAELHYDRQGLYRSFLRRVGDLGTRTSLADLNAGLLSDQLDLIFTYRSNAVQQGLHYISLPPPVSLGSPSHVGDYRRAFEQVEGPGPAFRGQVTGAPIRYAFAALDPIDPWVQRFLETLASVESMDLFRALGYLDSPLRRVRPVDEPR